MTSSFLYKQLFVTVPYPTYDFTGETIVVTGANTGLGLEAARHFVRLHAAKVILGVRSIDKGNAAKQSIEEDTTTTTTAAAAGRTGVVEVWQLDLASYDSVKAFARRLQTLPRLDRVVENAGVAGFSELRMAEEDEVTITVNVVSTMLLALLVLPKLRETAGKVPGKTPVLTIVSSDVHTWTKLPEWRTENTFETLSRKETANMGDRYPASKLLEVFAVRSLAARTQSLTPHVTINMLNPGLCQSELSRNASGIAGYFMMLFKFLLARTTEHGSRTLVQSAAGPFESHGKYWENGVVSEEALSKFVTSEDGMQAQDKIWRELCEKLERIQPGITKLA